MHFYRRTFLRQHAQVQGLDTLYHSVDSLHAGGRRRDVGWLLIHWSVLRPACWMDYRHMQDSLRPSVSPALDLTYGRTVGLTVEAFCALF
jgi:hypothetical protein